MFWIWVWEMVWVEDLSLNNEVFSEYTIDFLLLGRLTKRLRRFESLWNEV